MSLKAGRNNFSAALPGIGVLALVLLLTFGSVAALLTVERSGGLTRFDWAAIRFTLLQSLLSATISAALAVPLARALVRRRFPGRSLAITLLGAPFILPVIVAVLGLLAIWGRGGVVNDLLVPLGLPRLDIYGLPGILLAHVFFNLPLVTRLLLQGWAAIPETQFRLAAGLGLTPLARFRIIEMPMLRAVLPGAFLLVFLLCMTSFATVLALGGGPKATTVELAIYQALRFEFDLGQAARLALVQFAICGGVAVLALSLTRLQPVGGSITAPDIRAGTNHRQRFVDGLILCAMLAFLLAPLVLIAWNGVWGLTGGMTSGFAPAVATSLAVALGSAFVSTAMALALAVWVAGLSRTRGIVVEGLGLLLLAASPFVMGTGLFILLNPFASPFAFALPITGLLNAMAALPFALRALVPALRQAEARFGPLAASLDLTGWARLRLVTWPAIRRPAGFALGLAAALSMGDLGVITLFAPPGVETLPLYMYRLMGAYRMEEAAGAALVLMALSLLLFWVFDRGGRLGPALR
ncbi:thiamine/thiamine pyrophosphate ABC transporter permease ThiP [Algicella marina]|uniref:thiamine/thiamine pyrophosphate ABC transporter permease ThiP n=1 Tax=Algicella marina TaxID=2683284 RepID=UPI0024E015DC|nr:thiamine/thiamine pyrophosphate ABC transporter permease ThiP [Algicella marina]